MDCGAIFFLVHACDVVESFRACYCVIIEFVTARLDSAIRGRPKLAPLNDEVAEETLRLVPL